MTGLWTTSSGHCGSIWYPSIIIVNNQGSETSNQAASKSAQLGPTQKRLYTGYFKEVDEAAATWLQKWQSRNLLVSGPMTQEKEVQFTALLNVSGFDVSGSDASSGWLHCFQVHYVTLWKPVRGEANSADTIASTTWREEKLRVIGDYSPDDVYNADETGVFCELLPNKTLCYKDDTCKRGKIAKVRIVAFCCNASGTHRFITQRQDVTGTVHKVHCRCQQ